MEKKKKKCTAAIKQTINREESKRMWYLIKRTVKDPHSPRVLKVQRVMCVCVCVFLASGYKWVTVMHEIPISSAQSMTSFFHTLGLSSNTPLVPLVGAVSHEKDPTSP
jgi:hypothetical protein